MFLCAMYSIIGSAIYFGTFDLVRKGFLKRFIWALICGPIAVILYFLIKGCEYLKTSRIYKAFVDWMFY